MIYETFEILRDHATGRASSAQRNARWLVDVERWTGTFHEHAVNAFVADHKTLAQVMDVSYGTLHFIVPVAVLIWLWRRRPGLYRRWLMVIALLTLVSLPVFWRIPVAPPRLYDAGAARAPVFVDTDLRYGGMGPFDRGNFADKNPYAAMPSLHVAWSSWCACAVIAGMADARRRRSRWLAVAYPLWTLTVVVGTANHWVIDGVGGWIVLAGAWLVVDRFSRRRRRGKEDGARAVTREAPA